jgi:uncharacterized protein (DUF2062 family)
MRIRPAYEMVLRAYTPGAFLRGMALGERQGVTPLFALHPHVAAVGVPVGVLISASALQGCAAMQSQLGAIR